MAEEKKIFVSSGKEYDRDWLLDTIAQNTESYALHRLQMQPEKRNMFGKVKQQGFDVLGFYQAVDDIKKEIANGKLSRNAGNIYVHTDGITWDDPLHRAALDLVDKSLASLSETTSKEKTKYSNNRIYDRFNNKFYGGNFSGSDSDLQMWANKSRTIEDIKNLIDEEIADVNASDLDYTGSPFKDKNDHLSRLLKLRNNLNDNITESDYSDWVSLGGDGDFFRAITGLKKPEKTIEQENSERRKAAIDEALRADPSLTREDAEAAYDNLILSRKRERDLQHLKNTEDSDWDAYAASTFTSNANDSWSLNKYNGGKARGDKFWLDVKGDGSNEDSIGFITKHQNDVNRVLNNFRQGIINTGKIHGSDVTEDELLMVSLHYDIKKNPNHYIKAPDGSYIIKNTIQPDGTAYRYDPKKRTLYLYHATENTAGLNKYYHDEWIKNRYKSNTRYKFKNGGAVEKLRVLKALTGADIIKIAKDNAIKTKKEVEAKAKAEGKTYELYRAAKRKVLKDGEFDLDTTTSLRLAGAVSDIASAVAAFAPGYGTAASGVLSLGGIGADLAADMTDDSVTGWDATKNLVVNTGIGLAGLIPVIGTSGKFAKAAKTVVKLAPTLLALGSTVAGYDDAAKTIKKLSNNKDVSVEEWTLLGRWIASAAGLTRSGAAALKTHAIRATANKTVTEGESIKIKTTKGDRTLDAGQKNQLMQAKSPDEANGLLKQWFGDDAGSIKYDKSLLWKFWKGRKTSDLLPITTTTESQVTYDLDNVDPAIFGRRNGTKWGLSSDIDMLTGNGGIFGISSWKMSLPGSWNPYIRLRGTETTVRSNTTRNSSNATSNQPQVRALPFIQQSNTSTVSTSTQPQTVSPSVVNLPTISVLNVATPTNQNVRLLPDLSTTPINLNVRALPSLNTTPVLNTVINTLLPGRVVNFNLRKHNYSNEQMAKFLMDNRRNHGATDGWIDTRNRIVSFIEPITNRRFNYYYKQGGSINPLKELRTNFTTDNSQSSAELSKFLSGGTMTGVSLSDNSGSWYDDIFSVYANDLLNKLKNNGDDAMNNINSMQDRHYKIYTDANNSGDWKSKSYKSNDNSVREYQIDYDNQDNYGYNSKEGVDAIKQAYSKGRYSADGKRISGDGPLGGFKADNLFSSITDDRRILGRENDWDEDKRTEFNSKLSDLGYEMYLDDKTKYYKIRKLNTGNDEPKGGTSSEIGSKGDPGDVNNSSDNPINLSSVALNFSKITPEIYSLARFIKNLRNNKKITDLALSKQVALRTPIYKHLNVYGDWNTRISGEKAAANIEKQANEIALNTNDNLLAALTRLEGVRKANEPRLQAAAQDNAAIKLSIKESNAITDAMYNYNHEVGDENMARFTAKENADIDALMGKEAANTTNWNNFLSEREQRARIDNNDLKQRLLALYKAKMNDWYTDLIKNDPEYLNLLNQYSTATDEEKVGLRQKIQNFQTKKIREITPILREMERRYILGEDLNDFNIFLNSFGIGSFTATPAVRTARKGTKMSVDSSRMKYRADDLRELRKLIKHNIDTNRKALDNLSAATLLELKKMMGI